MSENRRQVGEEPVEICLVTWWIEIFESPASLRRKTLPEVRESVCENLAADATKYPVDGI